jgi:hypothetical protein
LFLPHTINLAVQTRLIQSAGWMCVVAIAVLSLVPGEVRPSTSAPGQMEHVAAYAGASFVLYFGYRCPLLAALALTGYAGCLEVAQNFVPGRHPQVIDWFASGAGAAVGSLAAWLCRLGPASRLRTIIGGKAP